MARYKGMRTVRPSKPQKAAPQFGLQAATRLHEAGIASNRGSAYRGECVPEPCTHRPSSHESGERPKPADPTSNGGQAVDGQLGDWD